MYWLVCCIMCQNLSFFCDLQVTTDLFLKAGDCYWQRFIAPTVHEALCPPGTLFFFLSFSQSVLVVYSGNDTLMWCMFPTALAASAWYKCLQHRAQEVQIVSIKNSTNVFLLLLFFFFFYLIILCSGATIWHCSLKRNPRWTQSLKKGICNWFYTIMRLSEQPD